MSNPTPLQSYDQHHDREAIDLEVYLSKCSKFYLSALKIQFGNNLTLLILALTQN